MAIKQIGQIRQVKQVERKHARGILKEALMLIPNFLKLLYRLLKDPRAPLAEKALLIGTIIYVVSPLDFIPDVVPFIGQVDDLYLIALVVLRLLSRTSSGVLSEHWDGAGDLAALVGGIERAARYLLPARVQRILLGRVEIAPQVKGGLLSSPSAPDDLEVERKIRNNR
ncbi:MAG: YkvA family protein [Blastocatellia bacterium]